MLSFLSIVIFFFFASSNAYINYTVVPGIFLQDDPATNATTFDYTATNFGLINRTYPSDNSCPQGNGATQWERLAHYIATLNRQATRDVAYKLIWFGRHGEGYHNAAESFYGTPAWNCFWSELNGNATVTWADAELTANGVSQALTANKFWIHELSVQKTPAPQSYYTSPLMRCLHTANLTFFGLNLPKQYPFKPLIKELFREGISGHTCDRRSTKTQIHAKYPDWPFEAGFSENDLLWQALHGETTADQAIRSKKVLDDVFTNDRNTYLSVTSHSGEIGSILSVLGHRTFSLNTGAVIPVLIKASTLPSTPPTTTYQAFTALSTCATAPTITASSCNDCSCCK